MASDQLTELKSYWIKFFERLRFSSGMKMGRWGNLLLVLVVLAYLCFIFLFVYVEPDEYGIKVVRVGMTRGVQQQV